MSSEPDEQPCPSQTIVDGAIVQCTRELGHPSVHLGRVPDEQSRANSFTERLHQWTDVDSVDANAPVDDLPVWYSALPIGSVVNVATRNGHTYEHVQLSGGVLDDHEQPAALRLDYRDELNVVRHVLLPWSRVSAIEWTDEVAS